MNAAQPRRADRKLLCVGMLLLQSALYSFLDPLAKTAYRTVPVYSFLMLRYLLAALCLLALRGRQILAELRAVPVRRYIVPSLCMAASFLVSNTALRLTAATNVAFLRSLSALLAPLLLLVLYHKPYGLRGLLRQLGMLAGLYLLCARGGLSGFGGGEVCALAAAALSAGALVFGGQALRYVSPVTLTCAQAGMSVLLCGVTSLAAGTLGATDWAAFTRPAMALTVLYAALGCTAAGYLLQNAALARISPRLAGVLQCTYPVMAALTAWLLLDEHLSPAGWLGAAVTTACVALESLQKE